MMNTSRKFPYLLMFPLFALLFFGGAIMVQAATYYVATTGSDSSPGTQTQPFQTIKRGISVLRAGDTLFIRGGTYFEGINSNSQTIPTGSSWNDAPIISGYPGETVILKPSGGTEVINLAHPYIQYVVFNGLVLDAAGLQRSCSAGYACSLVISGTNGAHHVRFKNIEAKNAAGSGVLTTYGSSAGLTYFEFIGCDIHHNGVEARDHGYYIGTSGNLVKNCKVHDNAGLGIHIYTGSLSVAASNNTIDGNDIYRNGTLSGSAPGILIDYGSGNRAMNNIVRGNKNGIIVGNPYVSGTSTSGSQVYNNTIYANTPGVGINIFTGSSQAVLENNIVYKNGGTILNTGSNTTITNNLFTDPMFVDEISGNFKLQSGSPAVDKALPRTEVRYDFVNTPRPQFVAPDIGAYEYSGNTTTPSPPRNLSVR